MQIHNNYPLQKSNTFGIDVKARHYAEFTSIHELQNLLRNDIFRDHSMLILGGGSNILFTEDYNGIIVKNLLKGIEIIKEDDDYAYVHAGAGEVWHDLVVYAIRKNLGGIENLSLIPGTVGAAPIQNIGAYGAELKDTFVSLDAFEIKTGKIRTFEKPDCCFGYRDSLFKKEARGEYIITSIILRLNKKPVLNTSYGAIQSTLEEMGVRKLSVSAISEAVCRIRRSKLPDPSVTGNAGSFFKNPEITVSQFEKLKKEYQGIPSYPTEPGKVKVPAGWLNEQCGWKGKTVGNTGVHKDQALVLVNYGNAKGSEIKALALEIKKSVMEKFGIELETEVNII